MKWIYATIGTPMWENYLSPEPEQSVMFYEDLGAFNAKGFPPITDEEWDKLQDSHR